MKKIALGLTLLFVLFAFAQANAAVDWKGEFFQYRFAVQPNGGVFYSPAAQYFNPDGQSIEVVTNAGATTGPFSDIAFGSLTEFGGAIQMNAMAKGPDNGVNPENGVLVQGYAEINLDEFGDNYGVDVDQVAKSWITRRFSVDESGDYYISAHLSGDADFAAFGDPVLRHHALYSYSGTVTLEEYRENPFTWLREVETFTFDNTTGDDMTAVELSDQPNVVYQLKIVLDIATDVKNLYMMTSITGALEGPFQVGSAGAPYELAAFVTPSAPIQYTLTVNTVGQGTVDPDGGLFDEGTVVDITATPAAGWEFDGWTGDVADPGAAATTVTMDEDQVITAEFTEIGVTQYTLDVDIVGQGTVDPAGGDFNEGTVVDITATPAAGWEFDSWTGNVADPDAAATTVTMDQDQDITATFVQILEYTLTVETEGQGTVDPDGGTFDEGTVVTITAIPADGWYFENWTGDVANPDAITTTVTMDDDKTVRANFAEGSAPQYALDVDIVGEGSVDPEGGDFDQGTVVDITATPADGWEFDSWTGDVADPDAASTTVTMDDDKTVTATFIVGPSIEYTLTVNTFGQGSVDPNGGVFDGGTIVAIAATPADGWEFVTWTGDVAEPDEASTTTTMNADKTITASFMETFEDLNENGIPDNQEVADGVDLNGDGISDMDQTDKIKSVNTTVGDCQMGVEVSEIAEWNVDSIDFVMAIDPADISDRQNRPYSLPIGLVWFELTVTESSEPASVTVYLCRAAANYVRWHQYDPTNGWRELDQDQGEATFSGDRRSIVLTLTDGGPGDADGTQNGIIVHCSGLSQERRSRHDHSDCFIGTAASELPFGVSIILIMIIAGSVPALAIGTYKRRRRVITGPQH